MRRRGRAERADPERQFYRFTQESLQLNSLEELAASVRRFLLDVLPASAAEVMVAEGVAGLYRSLLTPGLRLRLSAQMARRLSRDAESCPVTGPLEFHLDSRRRRLSEYRGGYVVPLPSGGDTPGLLLIGPSADRRAYTAAQRSFFAILANGLSVAASRIRIAEKMRAEEIRTAKIEKLAALGRLTAGIAHEFRNPLNIISTSAQTLLRNPGDAALHQEIARYILDEAGRLSRTIDEFLQFARPHTPVWEPVGLGPLFDQVLLALRPRAEALGVTITSSVHPDLPEVTTSPQHLQRTLVNLGLNGIEAIHHNGTLTLEALPAEGEVVRIEVRDTGHGISPEHQPRLFDPFFTTKPDGTGLGLPIVFMLVQTIRGRISYTTSPSGTTFAIDLPVDGSRS